MGIYVKLDQQTLHGCQHPQQIVATDADKVLGHVLQSYIMCMPRYSIISGVSHFKHAYAQISNDEMYTLAHDMSLPCRFGYLLKFGKHSHFLPFWLNLCHLNFFRLKHRDNIKDTKYDFPVSDLSILVPFGLK